MDPRGIRTCNPGNIRKSNTGWQGLANDQSSDPDFEVFRAPEWGIRAIMVTLRSYRRLYGLKTISQLIGRWAPPTENNTTSYTADVAQRLGVRADQTIDLDDPGTLITLAKAIVRHENGPPPDGRTDWYPPETYATAVQLALGKAPVAIATA